MLITTKSDDIYIDVNYPIYIFIKSSNSYIEINFRSNNAIIKSSNIQMNPVAATLNKPLFYAIRPLRNILSKL